MNPYYDADKLGLDLYTLEEDGLSYEFNMLCFWADKSGRVFTAEDQGCSCPTPFDGFNMSSVEGMAEEMDRIGSVEQAERTIDAWGKVGIDEKRAAVEWVRARLIGT